MFTIIILEILVYIALNIWCFIIGAILKALFALTLDQAATFTGILLFLNLIWLVVRLHRRETSKNNPITFQPNFSPQPTRSLNHSSNKPEPINKEIMIEYSDSEDEITTRKIRVKTIKYDKNQRKMVPYSLYAYCFLKKGPRNFILNRIISAYDAETGEIIDDIPKYLMQ